MKKNYSRVIAKLSICRSSDAQELNWQAMTTYLLFSALMSSPNSRWLHKFGASNTRVLSLSFNIRLSVINVGNSEYVSLPRLFVSDSSSLKKNYFTLRSQFDASLENNGLSD